MRRLIRDYKNNFTTENNSACWISFQGHAAGILKNNKPNTKRYEAASRPVLDALDNLKLELKESAKISQKYLFTREEAKL